jgi:undecaprenyl-diphosphatase
MHPAAFNTSSALGPALLLGVLQGVTEFLPISSSGHLVVGAHLLGFSMPALTFEVMLHVGTLLPVLWLYRADVAEMVLSLRHATGLRSIGQAWHDDRGMRLTGCVIIGTLPTVLMGAGLKDLFERLFSSPTVVGVTFLVTGGILMLSLIGRGAADGEHEQESYRTLTLWGALVVGVAQGMAITPGISRSGTTITAGLLLGFERSMAARFSFLLSIPAIVGALVLQLGRVSLARGSGALLIYGAGTLAAAISGYLALRWLVRLVRQGRLHWFAGYLWPLGTVVLCYLSLG